METFVGVQLKSDSTLAYWFSVPEELREDIRMGCNVICTTVRGNLEGKIVKILDGISNNDALKIIPERYFPLKEIIAVSRQYDLKDIYIPMELEMVSIKPEDIANRMKEFYDTGRFSKVIVKSGGQLVDGYDAVLVAKMFGHDSILGWTLKFDA